VRDYWLENSWGRFTIESCGVLGWFDANHPSVHYWGTPPRTFDQEDLFEDRNGNGILDPGEDLNNNGTLDGPDGILQPDEDLNANGSLDYDLNNDGWIHGHVEKWAEAIGKADQQFDFKKYDIDNDKNLSPEELTILVVIPQNDAFGTQRTAVGKEWPKKEPLTVDGVEIHTVIEAYIGSPPSLGLVAHELAHILLNAADMYFPGFFPYAAGPYSLMDQAPTNPPHLDPFHKLRLGWIVPKVITSSGWHEIPDVETHREVLILHDPVRGGKEYYMIENRWPGNSYDSYLPDSGLAVWHIIEDKSIFSTLPAPAGVSAGLWAGVYPHEWARRGIRLVRPIYGPPINFSQALWEGSIPQTSYDLLSVDPNPNHATLKWAEDGSPSGFSIQSIPVSGPKMNVYIGK
jgi:M6 family metalloprotease-like protein